MACGHLNHPTWMNSENGSFI